MNPSPSPFDRDTRRMLDLIERESPALIECALLNGARFIGLVFPEESRRTFYAAVHFDAGARREGAAEHGLAHFFEHLSPSAWTGPHGESLTTFAVERGWRIGAATSLDDITFSVESSDLDGRAVLEILPALVSPQEEGCRRIFAQERRRILRELEETGGGAPRRSVRQLEQAAFPGSGFDRLIIGTREQVSERTFDDVWRYGTRMLSAARATVVVSGTQRLVEATRQSFERGDLFIGDAPAEAPLSFQRALNWSAVPRFSKASDVALSDIQLEAWLLASREESQMELVALPMLKDLYADVLFAHLSEARGLSYSVNTFLRSVGDVVFICGACRVPASSIDESIAALQHIREAVVARITPDFVREYTARSFKKVYESRGMVDPVDFLRTSAARRPACLDVDRLRMVERLSPAMLRGLADAIFDPNNVRFIGF